jgi:hypothetical protein
MAGLAVACPNCKASLKAPESLAGKKAKCKKCGNSFRLPGGEPPTGDTVGESQFLSTVDLPSPAADANPFAFDVAPAPAPPKKEKIEEPKRKPEVLPKPAAKKRPKADDDDDIPAAMPVDEEVPAVTPLKLEEDEDSAPADPFSFSAEPATKTPPKEKNAKRRDDEPTEPAEKPKGKRGYQSREKSAGGSGKLIIAAAVFAVVVGGIIGGVLIYLNSNKKPETVNNEKKDEKKNPETPPDTTPKVDEKVNEPPKDKEKTKTPGKKDNPKKTPNTPNAGGPGVGQIALGNIKPIAFTPLAAKPENALETSIRLAVVPTLPAAVPAAFDAAKKVFPPLKRDIDVGVLWQTEPDFQGRGQKLLLGIYSPQTGKQVNQVTLDGDGLADPASDLSANADLFAHAHTGDNKVTIWNTRNGTKVIDGFNPYEDKKDQKLAAVYLTDPPEAFFTVSATGAVHAFRIRTKERIAGEFAPTKAPTKPLVAGKTIAPGNDRLSVVLVSGGTVYGVKVAPMISGSVVAEIGGDVNRPLGLAASASGRLLYCFETEKKEIAVMDVRGDGKHIVHRLPEKHTGEPETAGWAGDDLGMIGTKTGAGIWFDAEGTTFKPLALARTPGDKAKHVASDGHWALLPDPGNPKQCVLVEYAKPQSGIVGALDMVKQPPTVLLTDRGLMK